jgi:hypothetical protein
VQGAARLNPFSPWHLARRFFAVACARDLSVEEQEWVADHLDGRGLDLFWAQPVADRRHAHDVARWVAGRAPERHDLIEAALLHDVGKRHSRLGPMGRTVATLLRVFPLPEAGRLGRYTRHGALGAEELSARGYSGMVVAFAAWHHGPMPEGVDVDEWRLLAEADHRR